MRCRGIRVSSCDYGEIARSRKNEDFGLVSMGRNAQNSVIRGVNWVLDRLVFKGFEGNKAGIGNLKHLGHLCKTIEAG